MDVLVEIRSMKVLYKASDASTVNIAMQQDDTYENSTLGIDVVMLSLNGVPLRSSGLIDCHFHRAAVSDKQCFLPGVPEAVIEIASYGPAPVTADEPHPASALLRIDAAAVREAFGAGNDAVTAPGIKVVVDLDRAEFLSSVHGNITFNANTVTRLVSRQAGGAISPASDSGSIDLSETLRGASQPGFGGGGAGPIRISLDPLGAEGGPPTGFSVAAGALHKVYRHVIQGLNADGLRVAVPAYLMVEVDVHAQMEPSTAVAVVENHMQDTMLLEYMEGLHHIADMRADDERCIRLREAAVPCLQAHLHAYVARALVGQRRHSEESVPQMKEEKEKEKGISLSNQEVEEEKPIRVEDQQLQEAKEHEPEKQSPGPGAAASRTTSVIGVESEGNVDTDRAVYQVTEAMFEAYVTILQAELRARYSQLCCAGCVAKRADKVQHAMPQNMFHHQHRHRTHASLNELATRGPRPRPLQHRASPIPSTSRVVATTTSITTVNTFSGHCTTSRKIPIDAYRMEWRDAFMFYPMASTRLLYAVPNRSGTGRSSNDTNATPADVDWEGPRQPPKYSATDGSVVVRLEDRLPHLAVLRPTSQSAALSLRPRDATPRAVAAARATAVRPPHWKPSRGVSLPLPSPFTPGGGAKPSARHGGRHEADESMTPSWGPPEEALRVAHDDDAAEGDHSARRRPTRPPVQAMAYEKSADPHLHSEMVAHRSTDAATYKPKPPPREPTAVGDRLYRAPIADPALHKQQWASRALHLKAQQRQSHQ